MTRKFDQPTNMPGLRVFQYEGSPVQFETINGRIMANATLMGKIYSKKSETWLKTEKAKNYIKAISLKSALPENELVTIRLGSPDNGGGTWIHEKLILRYAQFLSTDFEVWCDEKIAELLREGTVNMSQADRSIQLQQTELLYQTSLVIKEQGKQISDLKEVQQSFTQRLALVDKSISEMEEAVLYVHKVAIGKIKPKANILFKVRDIANELGMTPAELNLILEDSGVQYRRGKDWCLSKDYDGLGYAIQKEFMYGNNKTPINRYLVWTESGRDFIMDLLNP